LIPRLGSYVGGILKQVSTDCEETTRKNAQLIARGLLEPKILFQFPCICIYRICAGLLTVPGVTKPDTWYEVVDKKSGLLYYWNPATGTASCIN
jgi:hypothetical protein